MDFLCQWYMVHRPKVIAHTTEIRGGNEKVYRNRDVAKGRGEYNEEKREKNPRRGKRRKMKGEDCVRIGRQWGVQCHEKIIGNLNSHRYVKTFVTSSQIVILQTR